MSVVAFIVATENESECEPMTYEKPISSVGVKPWMKKWNWSISLMIKTGIS